MANLNYAGETWKVTGALTDADGVPLLFSDLVIMEVELIDSRSVTKTYTKASGAIVQGSTTTSYAIEIPAADSILFNPGALKIKTKIEFPSADFTGNAIDIICETLLTISECQ
jgi:hypothetical protein